MIDDIAQRSAPRATIGGLAAWRTITSRRSFLRLVGLGGSLALLPPFVACGSDSATGATDGIPGSGSPLIIDFAQGDTALLQYVLVLEHLQVEFYSRVVAAFGTSNITTGEQAILTEIHDHELAHRAFLAGTIGAEGSFSVTPTFRGVTFTDRTSVLSAAKTLEELGVAAYNGIAQYATAASTLLALGKIVSVEARHATTIRDLADPRAASFAPSATDDLFRPVKVAAALQNDLVDKLGFLDTPSTFVEGPNANG